MDTRFPDDLNFTDAGMRGDSHIFRLISPFRYRSSYGTIDIHKGFETDGASIPKIFWSILSPFGPYFKAAVVHDFLYSPWNDEFSRGEADDIFKEAMYNIGINWIQRETIYRAVRLFGGWSFKGTPP
jgi:Protein of unknown function (DUF1353)